MLQVGFELRVGLVVLSCDKGRRKRQKNKRLNSSLGRVWKRLWPRTENKQERGKGTKTWRKSRKVGKAGGRCEGQKGDKIGHRSTARRVIEEEVTDDTPQNQAAKEAQGGWMKYI